MQEHGPHEAIEAVRKRLKHGTTQQKLRVFEVIKYIFPWDSSSGRANTMHC